MSSLGGIFPFLDKLSTDFSVRRLTILVTSIAFIFGCALMFESYTAHFHLRKLEKVVSISSDLSKSSDKAIHDQLTDIDRTIAEDLARIATSDSNPLGIPSWVRKAFFSAVPWFCVTLLMAFFVRDGLEGLIFGVALVALPFVIVGAILPDFTASWVNYLAYPLISCLIPVLAISAYGNRKQG